jgi:hypothetical protein
MKITGLTSTANSPERIDPAYIYVDFADLDLLISTLEDIRDKFEELEDRDTLVSGTNVRLSRYHKKLAKNGEIFVVFKR